MPGILLVVPRFHTNLFFATKALIDAGFRVALWAETRSTIEDYTYLDPVVLGRSPDAAHIRQLLADSRPDLVVLRHPCVLSKKVLSEVRRMRVRVLSYDQRPVTQQRGWLKRLSALVHHRPWERISPVPGLESAAPGDRATHFLPLPVAALPVPPDVWRDPASVPVRVLCVGKLAQARKRQEAVIDALAALSDRVTLTLVGATDEHIAGLDSTHRHGLVTAAAGVDWITIRSDMRFADMPALYAAHHVCVLASVREPLGSAPLEAMAYGTIPVISDGAGSAGFIRSGQNGLRVNMSDPGALGASLSRLIDDPQLRLRLSAEARRTAETDLSPELFVQRVQRLLA